MQISIKEFREKVIPRTSKSQNAYRPVKQKENTGCRFYKVGKDNRQGVYYVDNQGLEFMRDAQVAMGRLYQAKKTITISKVSYMQIYHAYYKLMRQIEQSHGVLGYNSWWNINQTDRSKREVEIKVFVDDEKRLTRIAEIIGSYFVIKHTQPQKETISHKQTSPPKNRKIKKICTHVAAQNDISRLKNHNHNRTKQYDTQPGTQLFKSSNVKISPVRSMSMRPVELEKNSSTRRQKAKVASMTSLMRQTNSPIKSGKNRAAIVNASSRYMRLH